MIDTFEKSHLNRETRNSKAAKKPLSVSRFVFALLISGATALTSYSQTTIPNTPPPPETGPATRPAPAPALTALSDVSLEQAVSYLGSLSGANVVVHWKVLEDAGVSRQSRVQITLTKPVTFRKLINLVLESASPQVPLVFEVQDNVISITTQTEADKHMVTRIYPIDDMLITPIPVPPANFELSAGGSGSGSVGNFQSTRETTSAQQEKTARAQTGEEFVRLVTTNIRPEIWKQNGGPASITLYQGKLIVTAPLSVHEKLH